MFHFMLMFVGTYTRNTASEGIYAFDVNDDFSRAGLLHVNRDIDNPSWLLAHPSTGHLYSVNETGDHGGQSSGAVSAFARDDGGKLSLLGQQASLGADPCHLAIDPGGEFLLVSNYSGGNLGTFPIGDDGVLGEFTSLVQHAGRGVDPVRQTRAHVHSATLTRTADMCYVCDLGTDEVVSYPLAARGRVLTEGRRAHRVKPGAGPRHFCFDAGDRYGYLINELDNTIISFERAEDGSLIELETVSALPGDYDDASYCAHIHLSSDGRFLYGSNRVHDSMVVIETGKDGQMTPRQFQPTGGSHPRHFCVSPDERFLLVANRDSDNIVVFSRDAGTGRLTETGAVIEVPAPSCILFV
ncbi:MAG: lactonase family protein [Pseudomonadales bacterium]|nr:lactonase family protein [Pseudomonadales bacterium]